MITYIKGDIFTTNADAIAQGCNCEGIMNGGLAKKIRDLYPDMYKEYKSICHAGFAKPGEIHLYYSAQKKPSLIINMFTQNTISEGARIEYIEQCLDRILENYSKWQKKGASNWKVKKIAMPRIGAGLGRLKWMEVKPILEKRVIPIELEIIIYSL